jgi:hypothetical protein
MRPEGHAALGLERIFERTASEAAFKRAIQLDRNVREDAGERSGSSASGRGERSSLLSLLLGDCRRSSEEREQAAPVALDVEDAPHLIPTRPVAIEVAVLELDPSDSHARE